MGSAAAELLSLATPYALHALTNAEITDIDARLNDAPADIVEAFLSEVRATRETMAVIATATAVEPPAHLREQLLREIGEDPVRMIRAPKPPRQWSRMVLAGAASVVIGVGALGVGLALRPAQTPSTAEQVFAAPDVRTMGECVARSMAARLNLGEEEIPASELGAGAGVSVLGGVS